jgi:hypothetical protein
MGCDARGAGLTRGRAGYGGRKARGGRAAIVWLYWSNLLFLVGVVLNARVEDARTSRSSGERTEQAARAQP